MNLRHRHVLNSNRANSLHLVWVLNSNRANSLHLVWVCFNVCFYHLPVFQRATVLKLFFLLWESMVALLCAVKVYVVCAVSYFLLCPSISNSFSMYCETQYNYGMCFLWRLYNLHHVSIVKFNLWRLFIMIYIQFAICFNGKMQFMAFVYLCIYVQFAVCINCEMQYTPFPYCELCTICHVLNFSDEIIK